MSVANVPDVTSSGAWFQYAADISQSTKLYEIKKSYDELRNGLLDGESLRAECHIKGATKPIHFAVEDFETFHWIMRQFDDPMGLLSAVAIQIVIYLEG